MSGYPLVGTTATLTSVSGSADLAQLLVTALKIQEVTVFEEAENFDVSELSGSGLGVERIQGISSGTFDFAGHFPKSAPRVGNTGLVTYNSGVVEFCNAWTLRAEFGEIDITSFAATGPTARTYMPNGLFDWSGTYSAVAVSGTAVTKPLAANTGAVSAVFKLTEDGASDPALSGSILLQSVRQTINKAQKQALEYTWAGSGTLTETKGATLPGLRVASTSAWGLPVWDADADGVADIEVVLTTASGRTITAYAFLRSLEISCEMGQPIRVSGTVRFNGTIARA